MSDKKFYLVKDIDDKLVAIFVNEEDCLDFVRGQMQYEYIELVIQMVKIGDCSYMKIKKVHFWTIEANGGKAVCSITLVDIDKYRGENKVNVSMSNLYSLLNLFEIKTMSELIGREIKCLINEKTKDINFISPLTFEKQNESDFIRCSQVHLNGT